MKHVSWPATEWEVSGKTVQTTGHEYLGVAKTKELAELFSISHKMFAVSIRAANGEKIDPKEFEAIIGRFRK